MKRRHFCLFRAFLAISNLIKMVLLIFISTSSNFYDLFLFNSGTFFNMHDFAVHLVWWRNKTYLDTFLYRSKCIHQFKSNQTSPSLIQIIWKKHELTFKSASSNPRVTSSDRRFSVSNPQVTSSNSWATSSDLQVTSWSLRVTCSNPRVTSSNTQVTSWNPRIIKFNENSSKQP